jgi:predicted AAA+ superfamily ATPase
MKRNQLEFMEKWFARSQRKPLVIRGARQVGKSTLVKLFAQQIQSTLNEVNLDRYPNLNSVFASKDPKLILAEIESLPKMPPIADNSLLFLDEIQSAGESLPALRYFYEECKNLPVVAAGSLLEFLLADHKFSMPVGRIEYLQMGPLVFTEFLDALGETQLLKVIKNHSLGQSIGTVAHNRLLHLVRTYFFVGGMPEAVKKYCENMKLQDASVVHQSILDTYRDDFPKYTGSRNLSRMIHVFNHAAKILGKKVKYSSFSHSDQSATIKTDIELLCLARLLIKVTHSNGNGIPLLAEANDKIYKLLFLDIGLSNAILGLNWNAISSLSGDHLVNEGPLAEQFVGQHLHDLFMNTNQRDLHYWHREGKDSNAEVDFLGAFGGRVIPIEVKAGNSGTLKSLHQFMGEKKGTLAIRFDTNTPSIQRIQTTIRVGNESKPACYDLISIPLYLVEKIPELVENYFSIT